MTSEQQEPDRGSETRVLCLLHEFGAMDEEAIANALDLQAATVTRCVGLLYARGLVRNVAARGKVCYESTGRWWPGEPSPPQPQLRDALGRYTHPPFIHPTMSPGEERVWVESMSR